MASISFMYMISIVTHRHPEQTTSNPLDEAASDLTIQQPTDLADAHGIVLKKL